jgi:hypothetical protein
VRILGGRRILEEEGESVRMRMRMRMRAKVVKEPSTLRLFGGAGVLGMFNDKT